MNIFLRDVRFVLVVLFAVLLSSNYLTAQTNLGAVQGHVQDQQNKALAGASVTRGFMFSGTAYLASGYPFNITTGANNSGAGDTTDRPVINGVVIGRDAGQAPPIYDFDFALQKSFKMTERASLILRAESYNTFNHLNLYSLNGVYGNGATPVATFEQPVGALANVGQPREMQFMARIVF